MNIKNIILLTCAVFLALSLYAEENENIQLVKPNTKKGYIETDVDKLRETKKYPLPKFDKNLKISNISFLRKLALSGKGEVLDVQIDIERQYDAGKSADSVDYSAYILALYETNAVDPQYRKLTPYPTWRQNDPRKSISVVPFAVLVYKKDPAAKTEEDKQKKDIWGADGYKNKVAAFKYYENVNLETSEILTGEKDKYNEPEFEDYLIYLINKPENALPFKIYGDTSPEYGKEIDSDKPAPDPAQLAKDIDDSSAKHTYTIMYSKNKTTLTGHHYSEYRKDYYFFNKVIVLLFDSKQKLVYKNIKDIGKIKMAY